MISATQLEFQASAGGKTQNERLKEIFLAKPNQWISMIELGKAIKAWAVHSRVADLRTKFNMNITNRKHRDPETGNFISFYYYAPSNKADL